MSLQKHICVVFEDDDSIQTWIVPLENGQEPEDAMRKFVLESDEWPFNHWNQYSFEQEIDHWRCFRLVDDPEAIRRLKEIQWPETSWNYITNYVQGLHRLAVYRSFAA